MEKKNKQTKSSSSHFKKEQFNIFRKYAYWLRDMWPVGWKQQTRLCPTVTAPPYRYNRRSDWHAPSCSFDPYKDGVLCRTTSSPASCFHPFPVWAKLTAAGHSLIFTRQTRKWHRSSHPTLSRQKANQLFFFKAFNCNCKLLMLNVISLSLWPACDLIKLVWNTHSSGYKYKTLNKAVPTFTKDSLTHLLPRLFHSRVIFQVL